MEIHAQACHQHSTRSEHHRFPVLKGLPEVSSKTAAPLYKRFYKDRSAPKKTVKTISPLFLLLSGCGSANTKITTPNDSIVNRSTIFYSFDVGENLSGFSNLNIINTFELQNDEFVNYFSSNVAGPYGSTTGALEYEVEVSFENAVISFDFFRVHTWDADVSGADDAFLFYINDTLIFKELFGPYTLDECDLSPSNHCDSNLPFRSGYSPNGIYYEIILIDNIDEHIMGGGGHIASKYLITVEMGKFSGNLKLNFDSTLDENLLNEYFAIDNLAIRQDIIESAPADSSGPEVLEFSLVDSKHSVVASEFFLNENIIINYEISDESGIDALIFVFSSEDNVEFRFMDEDVNGQISISAFDFGAGSFTAEYIFLRDSSQSENISVYMRDGSLRGAVDDFSHGLNLSDLDFTVKNSIILNGFDSI